MQIDKNEVLRYLGHKPGNTQLEKAILDKVDYYISMGITLIKPNTSYRIFNVASIQPQGVLLLENNLLLPGRDIIKHLSSCNKVCVVAATIGIQLENKVAELFNSGEYAAGTILDAVGSDAVEKVADQLSEHLKTAASKQGYSITWRFASGYGDFPLSVQHQLAEAAGAGNIGITVTDSGMLLPQKSIIGVIGFNPWKTDSPVINKCEYCSAENCAYRNRGDQCVKDTGKAKE